MDAKREIWTDEEVAAGIQFLQKVQRNGGWWPTEECMRAAHGAMSVWAPELVITESVDLFLNRHKQKILLTLYEGGVRQFSGMWHIPGGYSSITDESMQAACARIAKRELGIEARFIRTFGRPYLWRPGEHPYGRPLSLYCLVCPWEKIIETDSRKFFYRDNLPDDIVPAHRRFLLEEIF